MFSFFRRSKKESENKDKRSRESAQLQQSGTSSSSEVMCKNNSMTEKVESAPMECVIKASPSFSSATKLCENTAQISDVIASEQKHNTVTSKMNSKPRRETIEFQLPLDYASVTKRSENEVKARGSCVKPCGHGTVAISPRLPPMSGTKRESNSTPPNSPNFEVKKLKERSSEPKESVDCPPTVPWRKHSLGNRKDTEKEKNGLPPSPSDSATALTKSLANGPQLSNDSEKKNLVNQEAKFQSQLNDLSKQLSIRDAEANKLRFQMEELQRDVFAKSAGMDRLQAELLAAHKESEIVRQRIKHLESDLAAFKGKNSQLTENLRNQTDLHEQFEREAKAKISELEGVIKELQLKILTLEQQLEALKHEKEDLERQHAALKAERVEEKKKLAEVIEKSALQKQEIERKWKQDFEKLRTINILKEQELLDDFEWKLREVQQICKKRLDEKDKSIQDQLKEAEKIAEEKLKQAEDLMKQVENLKSYELEIEQLRGLTAHQEKALADLVEQQEQMRLAESSLKTETKRLRNLIELEKENLQHMQRMHHQEILDKERKLQQTLDEKRTEIAMYWEDKLLHEIQRLKTELEQMHEEERFFAMEHVKREKEEEFEKAKKDWEKKLKDSLKEIAQLKKTLMEKEEYFQDQIEKNQTNTDRDIMELRRLMDKIDMTHHERFEKLVQDHEVELENINKETERRIAEVENHWQQQVITLRKHLESVKEQMERESQQKIEKLIEQHRTELDAQWENLIHQKTEAVKLVEDEYVSKYRLLEDQFYTQQKSHGSREIELLKTIDSLKNELESKNSTIDDLQNNVDTLEGGIQVLNQEIAQQDDHLSTSRNEADQKIRDLQQLVTRLQEQQEEEREAFRLKLMNVQKQSQETIDHLQRKCNCLTKLFEEVRQRYERRESRQEDLNIIADLRQVIAEQEKDLACINEEKRFFQMKLMSLERRLEGNASEEEDNFEDAEQHRFAEASTSDSHSNSVPMYPKYSGPMNGPPAISIPPTILECDDCDE